MPALFFLSLTVSNRVFNNLLLSVIFCGRNLSVCLRLFCTLYWIYNHSNKNHRGQSPILSIIDYVILWLETCEPLNSNESCKVTILEVSRLLITVTQQTSRCLHPPVTLITTFCRPSWDPRFPSLPSLERRLQSKICKPIVPKNRILRQSIVSVLLNQQFSEYNVQVQNSITWHL